MDTLDLIEKLNKRIWDCEMNLAISFAADVVGGLNDAHAGLSDNFDPADEKSIGGDDFESVSLSFDYGKEVEDRRVNELVDEMWNAIIDRADKEGFNKIVRTALTNSKLIDLKY